MPRLPLISALVLCLATPSLAQELDGCTVDAADYADLVTPMLTGTWQVDNGPGVALGPGGFQVELPPEGGDAVTIEMDADGTLSGEGGPLSSIAVRYSSYDEEGFFGVPIQRGGVVHQQFMDFDIIDEAPDCDGSLLPLIVLSGSIAMDQNVSEQFTATLHFVNENTLSGVFVMDVAGLHGRRLITLTR